MTLAQELRDRMRLPAIVAPMFLVSGVNLAVESCKAGLMGTLTRNHCRTDAEFEDQLALVNDALAKFREEQPAAKIGPLAANFSLSMSSQSRKAALAACQRYGVEIVITTGGDPASMAPEIHAAGCRIFHDVISMRFAEKAVAANVDGIIAIGAGGGGHSGTLSHLAFIPQIRAMFDGVIVMAGAITTGAAIRAAEILGADLAYMGTRFIATRESLAPKEYKELIVSQASSDLLYSAAINGVAAMWMKESMRRLGLDPDNLPRPTGHRTEHLPPHVKPWKNLWSAGQGIGLIHDISSVAELTERLIAEYTAACAVPAFDTTPGAPAQ